MKDIITQLSHFVTELGLSASNTLAKMLLAISLFLTPLYGFFIVIIGFVLVDTVAGIYVSYRSPKLNGYESHKFFNMGPKLFFYLSTIICVYFVDLYILQGKLFDVEMLLSKALTLVWAHNEIKSMDEKSVKLGNRPFLVIAKDFILKLKDFKQDLNDLKN